MRIGIDGFNLAMPHGTGVATYAAELAAALQRSGHRIEGVFGIPVPADASLRETAFFDAYGRIPETGRRTNRYQRGWRFLKAFRRPRVREVPLTSEVDKQSLARPIPAFDRLLSAGGLFANAFTVFKATGRFVELDLADPPEVMHWTYPVPVSVRGIPNIYTLHDLVPLKLPHTTLDNKELYGGIVRECVRRAAQICTVSESSKRDIIERYGLPDERVTVTYQTGGVRSATQMGDASDDARAIEGIFGLEHRGYFLYFGAIEPKKNVGRLIEAYLSLQTTTPLVIVGARAWQSEQELRLMPDGGASGAAGTYRGHRGQTIVRLDYLSGELLAKLVRGAKAVVFPSLYEGFGLPVLEAMQLGTPVITSSTSSLPEIAGEAGLLVDPYDVNAIMAAMARLDGDAALGSMMGARGLEQARMFSQDAYRSRLANLYGAALAR